MDILFKSIGGGHCFFGGKIEPGENPLSSLERELIHEELQPEIGKIIIASAVHFEDYVMSSDYTYGYSLFESIISTEEILRISKGKVLEGKGVLTTRREITEIPFIYDMDIMVRDYLSMDK